jgi:hypothetical protein
MTKSRRIEKWLPLFILAAGVGPACAGEPTNMSETEPPAGLPRARDGNIAIAQELEAARRAGTVAAYDLFIARHPDHPLAETARREREALRHRTPPPKA